MLVGLTVKSTEATVPGPWKEFVAGFAVLYTAELPEPEYEKTATL
jgi:hypothetical protein